MAASLGGVRTAITSLAVVVGIAIAFLLVVGGLLLAIGTGVGLVGDFLASPGESAAGPPEATFAVERTDDRVTVSHAGGEPVPAEELRLEVDGEPTGSWADGGSETATEGDTVVLRDVEAGSTVTVRWVGEAGGAELHVETV